METKPNYAKVYESWGEFVAAASSTPKNTDSSAHYGANDFCGGSDFEETCKFAVEGWEEGTALAEKFSSALVNKLTNSLKIDEYYYDVTGQDFDLDRVLIGEPEAWLTSEQVDVKAPAQQTLKIQVNLCVSGGIDSNMLIKRGAVIAALAMLLERARRRVEIEIVMANGNVKNWWSLFTIPVKSANTDLDLAKVVFALAHPATFRRLIFGVMETTAEDVRKHLNAYRDHGYGRVMDVPPSCRMDVDIYVPSALYGDYQWKDVESAEQWILEQLEAQGVELKES